MASSSAQKEAGLRPLMQRLVKTVAEGAEACYTTHDRLLTLFHERSLKMVQRTMTALLFGALLGAQAVYAQEAAEPKPVRFDAMVKVTDVSAEDAAKVQILKPGEKTAIAALPHKAYPYGSTFTVPEGIRLRVRFSDLSHMMVRGPAVFTPKAAEEWRKVSLEIRRGDYNFSIDTRAQAGQFSVVTPLGTFSSMNGMSKLHVGDIAKGTVAKEDFAFRVLSGESTFNGVHYTMSKLAQANHFVSADAAGMSASDVIGRVGEVKMDLPTSGDGKNTPFSLTPGATVKITRAKARGSDNWVVSVLTLYANGEAKNYFCYVENRGEGFYTGELIAEVLPEEEDDTAAEDAASGAAEGGSAASGSDAAADSLDNFDDGDLL